MKLEYEQYYNKLKACYVGKCVGGTFGMPFEGHEGMLDLKYYDPIPLEMVANDDLDLQVVITESIRRHGLPVSCRYLAKTWVENIRNVWDEYGVAQRNIRRKLYPPASGSYDNKFYAGLGAAIRSEIWACLCPADPKLATELALEDSCIDHYDDGVEAACFLAALQSAAFTEKRIEELLKTALEYIPIHGRLHCALTDTINWWREFGNVIQIRGLILEKYGVQNFTDVSMNISFVLLGLLSGKGDFTKSICATVNCGYDTDCNGATLGALLGIMNPESIGEEWKRPIGEKLVLSNCIVGMHQVDTIDKMCLQIAALSKEVQEYYESDTLTVNLPEFPDFAMGFAAPWKKHPIGSIFTNTNSCRESVLSLTPLYTVLRYPEGISIPMEKSGIYELDVLGLTENNSDYTLTLRVPDGWSVVPSLHNIVVCENSKTTIQFEITSALQSCRNYVDFLDISMQNDMMRFDVSAGLMTSISWARKKVLQHEDECPSLIDFDGGENIEVSGHFQTVPAGSHILAMEFKSAVSVKDVILVSEGTRAMNIWLDDVLVTRTDGNHYVPASHRGPNRNKIDLKSQWHRMTIQVYDGDEGEIFIGMFKPYGHEWIEELETRRLFSKQL